MALKKLEKITQKQISENGTQALADRPNLTAQYGASGLSSTQLKLWFDKLATLLAEKINSIIDIFSENEIEEYISISLSEYNVESLSELVETFTSGTFAEKILQLKPFIGATEKSTLQSIINNFAKEISESAEAINEKIDKISDTSNYKRAYIILPDGSQATIFISTSAIEGHIPEYGEGGTLDVARPKKGTNAVNKNYFDDNTPTKLGQLQNDLGYLTEHQALDGYATLPQLQSVEAIAKGRSKSYTFETFYDLEVFIADPSNVANLTVGDNLYIIDKKVPDYWWDGKKIQELETGKVSLEDYQEKNDKSLKTLNKNIVGAINELNEVAGYRSVSFRFDEATGHLYYNIAGLTVVDEVDY